MTAAAANPFELVANPTLSNDGTTRLTWSVPEGAVVHVQRAPTPAFVSPTTLYTGTDDASVVTGMADGEYYFRAQLQYADGRRSPWSPVARVTVQHHSLPRALTFFTLGAVVLVATLLLIVFGTRHTATDA